VESYSDKIKEWLEKLSEKSKATKTDMYTQFTNFLNEKGCLGTKSIEVTDAMGLQVTHKSELTILQARHAFLSTQDPKLLAVGQPVYDLPSMLEALARCGEKKYSAILQMSFASRVRAMLQNVLGQATEMEVITEAVASEASSVSLTRLKRSSSRCPLSGTLSSLAVRHTRTTYMVRPPQSCTPTRPGVSMAPR
jgi:hypothetical protein